MNVDTATGACPFPGLRPFEPEDAHLFYGRERQTRELLQRLSNHRFLAVVGSSGSGKSSLVRAGLLPALRKGFLFEAGRAWETVVARPGKDPFNELAVQVSIAYGRRDTPVAPEFLSSILRIGGMGLVECARGLLELENKENLLVVIDQFEELFSSDSGNPARTADDRAAFVSLLLESSIQVEVPIYVLLTMRSDFLGKCQDFPGLPEMMNDTQFLVPRMRREELQLAITAPARIQEVEVSGALLQSLLNESVNAQDQLPVLQHVLGRMWAEKPPESTMIGLDLYERVGGFSDALDRHAAYLYGLLQTERQKIIARRLFQTITVQPATSEPVRRPTDVSRLRKIVRGSGASLLLGLSQDEVIDVINHFRQGCNFLRPYIREEEQISGLSRIDISHESLMRRWSLLRTWIEEEARASSTYSEVVAAARRWSRKEARPWTDPELQTALNLLAGENARNVAWAEQYGSREDAQLATRFLIAGRKERSKVAAILAEQENARRLAQEEARIAQVRKRWLWILGALSVFALVAAIGATLQSQRAMRLSNENARLASRAEAARTAADVQRRAALDERNAAMQATQLAQSETRRANDNAERLAVLSIEAQASNLRLQQATLESRALAEKERTARENAQKVAAQFREVAAQLGAQLDATRAAQLVAQERLETIENRDKEITRLNALNRVPNALAEAVRAGALAESAEADLAKHGPLPALEILHRTIGDLAAGAQDPMLVPSSVSALERVFSLSYSRPLSFDVGSHGPLKDVRFGSRGPVGITERGNIASWQCSGGVWMREMESVVHRDNRFTRFAMSPDGKSLAAGGVGGSLGLYDLERGKSFPVRRVNDFPVSALAFSANGKLISVGTTSGWIGAFQSHDLKQAPSVLKTGWQSLASKLGLIVNLSFKVVRTEYPINSFATLDSVEPATLVGLTDGGSLRVVPGRQHAGLYTAIAASPKGDFFILGEQDGTVTLATVSKQTRALAFPAQRSIHPSTSPVTALAFSQDGTRVAVGRANGVVRLHRMNHGQLEADFAVPGDLIGHNAPIHSIAFASTGDWLVVASADGKPRVWDIGKDADRAGMFRLMTNMAIGAVNRMDSVPLTSAKSRETVSQMLALVESRIKALKAQTTACR
jgi:WD40 repeat protein